MKKLISWVIQKVPRKYLQQISPVALRALGQFYKGSGVICPICYAQFRQFVPYGRGKSARKNALCPKCQSLERHRLLWLYLQERTGFFTQNQRLLHIAPESCFMERFRKMPNLTYTTADLESPLADVKMDIHEMPFANASFDVVFCNHVLEHVADDYQALREIYRVLDKDGWAILQVPFFPPLPAQTYEDANILSPAARLEAFGQEDHVRLYGEDYAERLASAGFEVLADDYVKQLRPEKIQQHALPAEELIYLCRK